jgi:iron complex outermembrane receptor protein
VVFTPKFLPGSSFEVDYWRTAVSHAILTGGIAGNLGNDFILQGCYGHEQNQAFCNDVVRNSTGVITQINSLNTNAGSQTLSGVDFEFSYDTKAAKLSLPFPGSVKFDLQLSKLIQDWQLNVDGSTTTYVGYFDANNEDIYPTWRAFANVDYRVANWNFHWDTRYIESMTDINGGPNVYGNKIPDMYYSAASVTYYFSPGPTLKRAKITVGIDNILDQDPPFIAVDSTSKSNTLEGPFDVVGRFFYSRLSLAF